MTYLRSLLSGHDEADCRTHTLSLIGKLLSGNQPDNIPNDYWKFLRHVLFMYSMKASGKWELSWDLWPDKDNIDLYPVDLVETTPQEFIEVLLSREVFKSRKDAKRNGWSQAPKPGDYLFKKKTMVVRVIEPQQK